MATDTLGRRLRFDAPDPGDKDGIVPQSADLAHWELIARHGPLPITYLGELDSRANYPNLQRRYTRLYHHGYVSRPEQQYASFHARYSPLVYDLTTKARSLITSPSHAPVRSSAWMHQFMQACVGASLELLAPHHGLRYISRSDILAKADAPLMLSLASGKLAPDDLFGLQGTDEQGDWYRFFAVEIDRNTESIERRDPSQNAFGKKLQAYLDVLQSAHFKRWGVRNLSVLTVTTNPVHAENLAAYLRRLNPARFAERFLFATEDSFGANWRVPKELLSSLYHSHITGGAPCSLIPQSKAPGA